MLEKLFLLSIRFRFCRFCIFQLWIVFPVFDLISLTIWSNFFVLGECWLRKMIEWIVSFASFLSCSWLSVDLGKCVVYSRYHSYPVKIHPANKKAPDDFFIYSISHFLRLRSFNTFSLFVFRFPPCFSAPSSIFFYFYQNIFFYDYKLYTFPLVSDFFYLKKEREMKKIKIKQQKKIEFFMNQIPW